MLGACSKDPHGNSMHGVAGQSLVSVKGVAFGNCNHFITRSQFLETWVQFPALVRFDISQAFLSQSKQ